MTGVGVVNDLLDVSTMLTGVGLPRKNVCPVIYFLYRVFQELCEIAMYGRGSGGKYKIWVLGRGKLKKVVLKGVSLFPQQCTCMD